MALRRSLALVSSILALRRSLALASTILALRRSLPLVSAIGLLVSAHCLLPAAAGHGLPAAALVDAAFVFLNLLMFDVTSAAAGRQLPKSLLN